MFQHPVILLVILLILVTGCSKDTALTQAAGRDDFGTVKALLAQGANVNECNEKCETPLMFATAHARIEIVQLLLAHGADVHARNTGGTTALFYAASTKGRTENAKVLLASGADANATLPNGYSP